MTKKIQELRRSVSEYASNRLGSGAVAGSIDTNGNISVSSGVCHAFANRSPISVHNSEWLVTSVARAYADMPESLHPHLDHFYTYVGGMLANEKDEPVMLPFDGKTKTIGIDPSLPGNLVLFILQLTRQPWEYPTDFADTFKIFSEKYNPVIACMSAGFHRRDSTSVTDLVGEHRAFDAYNKLTILSDFLKEGKCVEGMKLIKTSFRDGARQGVRNLFGDGRRNLINNYCGKYCKTSNLKEVLVAKGTLFPVVHYVKSSGKEAEGNMFDDWDQLLQNEIAPEVLYEGSFR